MVVTLGLRQHPCSIMYEQKFGQICRKAPNKKKDGSGQPKNRKLDNAQKLRGICYTDPDDMEFQDTLKNARKKPEVPLESAML